MVRRARHIILPDALSELERHNGEAVTASKIAHGIKAPKEAVQNSLQNYWRGNKDGCVERVASGIFRWRCVASTPPPPAVAAQIALDDALLNDTEREADEQAALARDMLAIATGAAPFRPQLTFLYEAPNFDENGYTLFTDQRGRVWAASEL